MDSASITDSSMCSYRRKYHTNVAGIGMGSQWHRLRVPGNKRTVLPHKHRHWPDLSCNNTFTALQTAMNNGTSYFAEPVVLAPMTSNSPLLARYSYMAVTSLPANATMQIVSSHGKLPLMVSV